MSELIISTLVKEMKNSFKKTMSYEALLNLLCEPVIESCELQSKNGDQISIDKSKASKIINRNKNGGNLPKTIVNAPVCKHYNEIYQFFEKSVVSILNPNCIDDLIHRLKKCISDDQEIADSNKNDMLDSADKDPSHIFFANVFLYTLTRDNRSHISKIDKNTNKIEERKKKPLPTKTIPDIVKAEEMPYIAALFDAYGQVCGVIKFDASLFPKHLDLQKHYNQQRKYYFAAESLNEEVRDVYGADDGFNTLKDEIYEGTIEVWGEQHQNGLSRLKCVLEQVTQIKIDSCFLTKETEWVTMTVKKGVCHFLVNDGSFEGWVRDDDEQQPV